MSFNLNLIKVKIFIKFVATLNFIIKNKNMGKGDKKSKRGKITLGSYGVRRLRKKSGKAMVAAVKEKEEIVKTIVIEKKKVPEIAEAVVEQVVIKEAAPVKAAKPAKEKKETKLEKPAKEPKAKKEKKAE